MIGYQLYWWRDPKGYELIGVLPERRKDPQRITDESVLNWGKSLLGDTVNSKEMFSKQVAIDRLLGKIL